MVESFTDKVSLLISIKFRVKMHIISETFVFKVQK